MSGTVPCMTNLSDIPFECKRPITFYYMHPTRGKLPEVFEPGKIIRKSPELVGKLLSQVDSYGTSPLERYLDAGIVRYLADDEANAKVEGKIPIIRPPLPEPLQAAAKAYASAKSEIEKVTNDKREADERARAIAIDAGRRVARPVEVLERNKTLRHGEAVDVDELAPGALAIKG